MPAGGKKNLRQKRNLGPESSFSRHIIYQKRTATFPRNWKGPSAEERKARPGGDPNVKLGAGQPDRNSLSPHWFFLSGLRMGKSGKVLGAKRVGRKRQGNWVIF